MSVMDAKQEVPMCGPTKADRITEALRTVNEWVRNHSTEDQQLVKKLFMHLLTPLEQEERDETVKAVVEILCPKKGSIAVVHLDSEDRGANAESKIGRWVTYVGNQIKALRDAKGWTQDELASRSGLTQSHVCRIETGMHSPSHKTLVKIAQALGIEVGKIDPGL